MALIPPRSKKRKGRAVSTANTSEPPARANSNQDLRSQDQATASIPTSFEPLPDGKVQKFLRDHESARILVGNDYSIYYVEHATTRAVCNQLQQFLREKCVGVPQSIRVVSVTDHDYTATCARIRSSNGVLDDAGRNPNVQIVLDEAIKTNASDIYLDVNVEDDSATVHLRVYGERHFFTDYDASEGARLARALFRRDPMAHYEPKDPCNCAFNYEGIRVRGSLLPESRGVSTVFRARDPNFNLPLPELGFSEVQQKHITRMIRAPGGLGVLSGPTNSGKSTTLSSVMAALPLTQKIIEIADPIEVLFPYVTHVPIDHYREDAEQVFPMYLAELVRQNPDSLFIGEIRDSQTAEAAKNMSIQGKRVWTTLHTQHCATAIPRLDNLGVDHHLLQMPGFLTGVISQNLVPVLCRHCYREEGPEDQYVYGTGTRYRNPDGCDHPDCYRGISGQTIVAEVWPLCVEEAAGAFRYIIDKDFVSLREFMIENVGVLTKEEHALGKVEAGICDPFAVQDCIGEFPPSLFADS